MIAYREHGDLYIKINEEALCSGAQFIDLDSVTISDREKYLNFLATQICSFGENGDFESCSNLTKLVDDLVIHAIECDAGIA